MSWKATEKLMETIRHYANFPATGVSLRQMVQFGDKPSTGQSTHPFVPRARDGAAFARPHSPHHMLGLPACLASNPRILTKKTSYSDIYPQVLYSGHRNSFPRSCPSV